MENDLENKAKFFAQYWLQEVLCSDIFHYKNKKMNGNNIPCDHYLELKPLSSITDEELFFVGKLFGWDKLYGENHPNILRRAKEIIFHLFSHPNSHCELSLYLNLYDFLRFKGYTLPWMGLSVEKQIEYGWIKLKEN